MAGKKVDEFIDSKQPAQYDEAVKLPVDLRDLNKKTGKEKAFNKKMKTIYGIGKSVADEIKCAVIERM